MRDPNQVLALTETVRDILIILGSLALVVLAGFMAFVGWQLYRLGKELHAALRPILASAQGTSEAVEAVSEFVQRQLVSPGRGIVSLGMSGLGLYRSGAALFKQWRPAGSKTGPKPPGES